MRPTLEKPSIPEGHSWALLDRRLADDIPFQWHYHREYELTLTLNSQGQRFVGDHVGSYADGDLVLLGPNLPHTWASSAKLRAERPHVALVMWFRQEWTEALAGAVPEFAALQPMLLEASRGLSFSPSVREAVRPTIEGLVGLPPARRLLALLDVLVTLAGDRGCVALTSPDLGQGSFAETDRPRIERVLDHIHAHYRERLTIEGLAQLAHLSPSGLHRLFQRHTRMSALDYVAQLRIGRACRLLISTQRPIAHIAAEAGYENLSHFNRQFRALKHATPREFRRGFTPPGAS